MIINKRTAHVMPDGRGSSQADGPHYPSQYYKPIQPFSEVSAKLCEEGKFKKLKQILNVACKLFKNGNETVRSGIANVYLFTLPRVMDQIPAAKKSIMPFMPNELRMEYARMHYIGGL